MRTALVNSHAFFLGLTLALSTFWPGFARGAGLKAGDTFPDLAGFKLEGKLPDALKGKVVMIDFWASWCDPCKASFPAMNDLQKAYGQKGLVIVAVNVDESRNDMEDFLKKNAAAFTVVRDVGQKLVARTGIATMPTSFLLDGAGTVRYVHSGFHGDDTSRKYKLEIETLLTKATTP